MARAEDGIVKISARALLPFVVVLAVVVAGALATSFSGPGPRRHLDGPDSLVDPKPVSGWTEKGITLENGEVLKLPDFNRLPLKSEILRRALEHGVETDGAGRVYGLIRVWHWCGNDAVASHLARVDVAHLLMFFNQGEFKVPHGHDTMILGEGEGSFSSSGWNISEHMLFDGYSRCLRVHSTGRSEPPESVGGDDGRQ